MSTERASPASLYLSSSVLARRLPSQKGPGEAFSAFDEAGGGMGLAMEQRHQRGCVPRAAVLRSNQRGPGPHPTPPACLLAGPSLLAWEPLWSGAQPPDMESSSPICPFCPGSLGRSDQAPSLAAHRPLQGGVGGCSGEICGITWPDCSLDATLGVCIPPRVRWWPLEVLGLQRDPEITSVALESLLTSTSLLMGQRAWGPVVFFAPAPDLGGDPLSQVTGLRAFSLAW